MSLLHPDFGLIFWTLVVFLLTLFILRRFAWKPILKTLNDRERSIADSITTAERIKAEMSQLKSEHEQVLLEAREERSQILKQAKEAKDAILEQARLQARQESRKILDDAREAIQNQKMAALTDVKNQIGILVIEVAEKILRKELADRKEQQQYIRDLTSQIKLN